MDAKLFEIDARLGTLVDLVRRCPESVVSDFREKLELSWIFHDHGLEGVVVSYSELRAAIDHNIISDVSLIPTYEEIKALKRAIAEVREMARQRRLALNMETLRRLYVACTPGVDEKTVAYRKDNPLHRAYYHEIAPPDKIAYKMRKLVEWFGSDEVKRMHPVQFAARAHYRLLAIYPWPTNNGRVGRLLQNLILLHAGYPPAVIHTTERQRYYESLRHEHAGLVPLVMESLSNSIETCTKYLNEHVREHSRVAS